MVLISVRLSFLSHSKGFKIALLPFNHVLVWPKRVECVNVVLLHFPCFHFVFFFSHSIPSCFFLLLTRPLQPLWGHIGTFFTLPTFFSLSHINSYLISWLSVGFFFYLLSRFLSFFFKYVEGVYLRWW